MDPGNEEPFDREAWRRLMAAETGAPTKDMDARILAAARRPLVPPIGRWWLPASLAASLLLAVLIVQWQLADTGTPAPVTESDVLAAPAPVAAEEDATSAATEFPAQPRAEAAKSVADVPAPFVELPPPDSQSVPVAAPPAAAPVAESSAPALEGSALWRDQSAVAPAPRPAAAQEQAEASTAVTTGKLRAMQSPVESRTPEQWYADIEALRAAGRIKEADAELARLESRYPGWLERHQQNNP